GTQRQIPSFQRPQHQQEDCRLFCDCEINRKVHCFASAIMVKRFEMRSCVRAHIGDPCSHFDVIFPSVYGCRCSAKQGLSRMDIIDLRILRRQHQMNSRAPLPSVSDGISKTGGDDSGPSGVVGGDAGDRARKAAEYLESDEAKRSKSG
ncbi:unnamed protein product, partial [Brassica napus]